MKREDMLVMSEGVITLEKLPGSDGELRAHIPLRLAPRTVTVWLSSTYCRYYKPEELPDWIKRKLAMISTCDNKHLAERDRTDYSIAPNGLVMSHAYLTSKRECPEGFEDIGWRVNAHYYYIVATMDEYDELISNIVQVTERLR